MSSKLVDVDAELVHETELAYLIDDGSGRPPVWVPKSVVEYDEGDGTFTMPRHLAEEKGLV